MYGTAIESIHALRPKSSRAEELLDLPGSTQELFDLGTDPKSSQAVGKVALYSLDTQKGVRPNAGAPRTV